MNTFDDLLYFKINNFLLKFKDLNLLKQRDECKQRKIDGLLKLIQQKNNEIESLKIEIFNKTNMQSKSKNSFIEQLDVRHSFSSIQIYFVLI